MPSSLEMLTDADIDASPVKCPICTKPVPSFYINSHIDSGCQSITSSSPSTASQAPTSSNSGKRKATTSFASIELDDDDDDDGDTIPIASTSLTKGNIEISTSNGSSSKKRFKLSSALESAKPLAERVRPSKLDDFVGQEELIGKGTMLRGLIEGDRVGSCLFWGPPGTGKTTIARVIAQTTSSIFKEFSATSASAADLRKTFEEATNVLKLTGRKTLLFIDEIQRFNKAQQDLFLPVIESGQISLIASTTENPSFRVNNALLSRCRVFVLKKLEAEDIFRILCRALRIVGDLAEESTMAVKHEPVVTTSCAVSSAATAPATIESPHKLIDESLLRFLSSAADGDARVALSSLELALSAVQSSPNLSQENLKAQLRRAHLQYDRSGDAHYDTISALHKSIRGSDADAALYWLARMLAAGDDPTYVARRLIRMASEDIGLADPTLLGMAVSAYQATQLIGMPECDCILAQVVVALAEAKKSVRVYKAMGEAKRCVREGENWPVPMHIRNAPTKLMKGLGYGKDYKYEPSFAHPVHQDFLPPELKGTRFLKPEESLDGKDYDEEALREWEELHQDGRAWEGRAEMMRKLRASD